MWCDALTDLTIPNGVKVIGSSAWNDCGGLTHLSIPDSVTEVGGRAFFLCGGLTNVTIGRNVISVGESSFRGCHGLTSVTIPDNVIEVGAFAFDWCKSLRNVLIGNGATQIGQSAFARCGNLNAIEVDEMNPNFGDVDGILFDKAQRVLFTYPPAKTGTYSIPDTVQSIARGAFSYAADLTAVRIPNSVTNIGAYGFESSGLTNVTIPDGVTEIGERAFGVCTNLTSVTIASSVTEIGEGAFRTCNSLKGVYFEGNAPLVVERIFSSSNVTTVFYLPGTIGWEPAFGGAPTAPWVLPQPVILTLPRTFGIQSNWFGFRVSWATNSSVIIEASNGEVETMNWVPIGTSMLVDGWTSFYDPEWNSRATRIYRARSP